MDVIGAFSAVHSPTEIENVPKTCEHRPAPEENHNNNSRKKSKEHKNLTKFRRDLFAFTCAFLKRFTEMWIRFCSTVMIIVLFHVFYLLGKLIYRRYNCCKQTQVSDIVNTECCGVMYLPSKDRNSAMGKLAQPPGDTSDDEVDMESKITFFPPAYIQRYIAVQAVFEEARYRGRIRKVLMIYYLLVLKFGCF